MLDGMDTSTLWEEFMAHRSPLARGRLAVAYLPLVSEQVQAFAERAPQKAEELPHYGVIGLLKAIEMFDQDRGVPFEPFARSRIRGAISDFLRTLAVGRARAGTGVRPSGRGEIPAVPVELLRDAGGATSGDGRALDDEVWRAIDALSVSHKLVIGLHYCDGVALKEVSRILGISRRDVQALREAALHSVRTHLSLRSWLDRGSQTRLSSARVR